VADRVSGAAAREDPSQTAGCKSALKRAATDAELQKLLACDNPVLTPGELGDLFVVAAPAAAVDLATY
jgi:hypothetical protein